MHGQNCGCHTPMDITKATEVLRLIKEAKALYDGLTVDEQKIVDGNLLDMELGAEH